MKPLMIFMLLSFPTLAQAEPNRSYTCKADARNTTVFFKVNEKDKLEETVNLAYDDAQGRHGVSPLPSRDFKLEIKGNALSLKGKGGGDKPFKLTYDLSARSGRVSQERTPGGFELHDEPITCTEEKIMTHHPNQLRFELKLTRPDGTLADTQGIPFTATALYGAVPENSDAISIPGLAWSWKDTRPQAMGADGTVVVNPDGRNGLHGFNSFYSYCFALQGKKLCAGLSYWDRAERDPTPQNHTILGEITGEYYVINAGRTVSVSSKQCMESRWQEDKVLRVRIFCTLEE